MAPLVTGATVIDTCTTLAHPTLVGQFLFNGYLEMVVGHLVMGQSIRLQLSSLRLHDVLWGPKDLTGRH